MRRENSSALNNERFRSRTSWLVSRSCRTVDTCEDVSKRSLTFGKALQTSCHQPRSAIKFIGPFRGFADVHERCRGLCEMSPFLFCADARELMIDEKGGERYERAFDIFQFIVFFFPSDGFSQETGEVWNIAWPMTICRVYFRPLSRRSSPRLTTAPTVFYYRLSMLFQRFSSVLFLQLFSWRHPVEFEHFSYELSSMSWKTIHTIQ